MARRSQRYIRLEDSQHNLAIEKERDECLRMVAHFERKGLQNTYWHKTLKRLNAALEKLEGEQEDGEQMGQ